MKKSRHTESEIITILKEQESRVNVADICRQHGISQATFFNWKSKYGGMELKQLRKIKTWRPNWPNKNLDAIGKVLKPEPFEASLLPEGNFPGLMVQTSHDIGTPEEPGVVYILKWETLNRNRDRPRQEPWPEPSQLYLYKLKLPQ